MGVALLPKHEMGPGAGQPAEPTGAGRGVHFGAPERGRSILTVVRTTGAVYEAIKQDIDRYAPKETMLFSRARQVRLGDRELYLMPAVIALDEDEACRSSGLTQPSPVFQQWFYGSLKKEGLLGQGYRVVTIHSHPFQTGEASFSAAD